MIEPTVPADVTRAQSILARYEQLGKHLAADNIDIFFLTGHRPHELGHKPMKELVKAIPVIKDFIQARLASGRKTFAFCGMADGFDLLGGSAVLQLQNEGVDIHLVAAMPYPKFGQGWEDNLSIGMQRKMLERALYVIRASMVNPKDHDESCIYLWTRNMLMIVPSRWGVSCLSPKAGKGGTVNAVRRAEKLKGVENVHNCWREVALALGLVEPEPERQPTLFDALESGNPVAITASLMGGRVVRARE